MNLVHLRTFREVAAQGGFGRAARSLYLTQSAVSMQIASLERELGVRLFERLGRHVALTRAGQVFLDYATHIGTLVDEASRAMEEIRGEAETLAVGASPTISDHLAPPLLARLRRQRPAVRVTLEVAPTAELAERLIAGSLDVGLVEEPVASPELTQTPLVGDELVLVVSVGHRWAERDAVSPQELATEPFIASEPTACARQIIDRCLEEHGVHLRPTMEVASPAAIKTAVQAGLGVAILSTLAVRLELSVGVLRAVPLQGIRMTREFQIVRKADRPPPPVLTAFLSIAAPEGV